jgi:hypothetical protein
MRHTICLLLGCTAMACGGSSLPPPKVTGAEKAITAADAVGAEYTPQGALHLKMARDRLAEAKRLLEDGESDEARLVLEGAKADAELSLMLARTGQARAAAEQARRDVNELTRGESSPIP